MSAFHRDSRLISTGRHPDYQIDPRGQDAAAGRVMSHQQWAALIREVNTGMPPGLVVANEKLFVDPREAAQALGLPQAQTALAQRLIEGVAASTRDMLGIVTEARRGGIPEPAVSAILRRGQQMRWRQSLRKSDADGKDTKGQAKANAVDPDLKRRYEGLAAQARRHGVSIRGRLKSHHTHEHLDDLEERLRSHVADRKGKEEREKRVKRGAPVSEPAKQAAANEVGALVARLTGVQHRVDDDHAAVYERLVAEGKSVSDNPNGEAIDWYERRVESFLHLLTGQGPDGDDGPPPRFAEEKGGKGAKADPAAAAAKPKKKPKADDDDEGDAKGKFAIKVEVGKSEDVYLDLIGGDLLLKGPQPAPVVTPQRRKPVPPPPRLVVEPEPAPAADPLAVWGELQPLVKSRGLFGQLIDGHVVISGDLRRVPAHLLEHPMASVQRLDMVGAGDLVKAWSREIG